MLAAIKLGIEESFWFHSLVRETYFYKFWVKHLVFQFFTKYQMINKTSIKKLNESIYLKHLLLKKTNESGKTISKI